MRVSAFPSYSAQARIRDVHKERRIKPGRVFSCFSVFYRKKRLLSLNQKLRVFEHKGNGVDEAGRGSKGRRRSVGLIADERGSPAAPMSCFIH